FCELLFERALLSELGRASALEHRGAGTTPEAAWPDSTVTSVAGLTEKPELGRALTRQVGPRSSARLARKPTAPAHPTAPVKQNPAGARRTHAGRHDLCHRARQGANPLAGGRTRAPDRGPPRRTRQTAVWRRHGPGLLGLTLTLLLSPSCREGLARSPL